jgi:hypothetical protein
MGLRAPTSHSSVARDTVGARVTRTTLFSVILLACLTAGCQTTGVTRSNTAATVRTVAPADRLYVASLSLIKLDQISAAESQRLERVCPPPRPSEDTCRPRNVSSQRHRVATLYSRPEMSSPPAAFINARFHFRPGHDFQLALDLEFVDRPGEFVPWIPDAGDWGYSIHIDGRIRVEGDWVQFIDPVFRMSAWMRKEAPHAELYLHVDSIAGEILHLKALEATNPNGVREVIEPGDFLITRVSQDAVEFRAEVASDYACGDDIPPPAVLPPVLRARPGEFFTPDGTPRFTTKYAKGC